MEVNIWEAAAASKVSYSVDNLRLFSELPLLRLRFSGIRVALSVYLIVFGFFGYGSEIDLGQPKSVAPALAGLLVLVLFCRQDPSRWLPWTTYLNLRVKHLSVFLVVFLLYLAASLGSLNGELVGDELAYVGFSTTHATQLLERFDFGMGGWEARQAIQLSQFLFLTVLATLLWAIAKMKIKVAIAFTAGTVLVAQFAFAVLGGWGWGYAEISWLPYMVTTAIFGVHSFTYSATSLAIVSFGVTLLFFGLKRVGMSIWARVFAVATVGLIPIPLLYFSSLDHVIYFMVFGAAAVPFLIQKLEAKEVHIGLLLVGLGVTLRLTVLFVLLAVFANAMISGSFARRESWAKLFSNPAVLVLVPYGAGIALFPPVFSSEVNSGVLGSLQGLSGSLPLITMQAGQLFLPMLVVGLLAGLLANQNLLPSLALLVSMSVFFFGALGAAGLHGALKYSVEWLPASVALSLALLGNALFQSASRFPKNSEKRLRTSASLITVAVALTWLSSNWLGQTAEDLRRSNAYAPQGFSHAIAFIRESGLDCAPTGVVYGAGNEVLGGLSLDRTISAHEAFLEVQATSLRVDGSWTALSEEAAKLVSSDCIYGLSASLVGYTNQGWSGWRTEFKHINPDSSGVTVIRRVNE